MFSILALDGEYIIFLMKVLDIMLEDTGCSCFFLLIGVKLLKPLGDLNVALFEQYPLLDPPLSFKHLGVQGDKIRKNLFALNCQPLLDKTISYLANWTALPLSLIGRIDTIKMGALSKVFVVFFSEVFPSSSLTCSGSLTFYN